MTKTKQKSRRRPRKPAHVIWLLQPLRLLGTRGPLVVGIMSDAPVKATEFLASECWRRVEQGLPC